MIYFIISSWYRKFYSSISWVWVICFFLCCGSFVAFFVVVCFFVVVVVFFFVVVSFFEVVVVFASVVVVVVVASVVNSVVGSVVVCAVVVSVVEVLDMVVSSSALPLHAVKESTKIPQNRNAVILFFLLISPLVLNILL